MNYLYQIAHWSMLGLPQPQRTQMEEIPTTTTSINHTNTVTDADNLTSIPIQSQQVATTTSNNRSKSRVPRSQNSKLTLSHFYSQTMRRIATRSVIRLNSTIKRTFCSKCQSLLIPAHTMQLQAEGVSRNQPLLTAFCKICKRKQRIGTNSRTYAGPRVYDQIEIRQDEKQEEIIKTSAEAHPTMIHHESTIENNTALLDHETLIQSSTEMNAFIASSIPSSLITNESNHTNDVK
jgi:RNase P subunit RPR2